MSTPTFKELYEFVLANKGTKTFMGYSDERIASMLLEGLNDETLFYNTDINNKITGMILAIKDTKTNILFVTENLSMTLNNLKAFARKSKLMFPSCTLQAIRHGGHRVFNTEKLYQKLGA